MIDNLKKSATLGTVLAFAVILATALILFMANTGIKDVEIMTQRNTSDIAGIGEDLRVHQTALVADSVSFVEVKDSITVLRQEIEDFKVKLAAAKRSGNSSLIYTYKREINNNTIRITDLEKDVSKLLVTNPTPQPEIAQTTPSNDEGDDEDEDSDEDDDDE